jgi:endonuclease/exonuclease/phosphatase family metal-dependent hydrolase
MKRILSCSLLVVLLAACKHVAHDTEADNVDSAHSVTIMTFNVQNLFDNVDDPGKDDKAYLPLEAKQNDAHIAACNEIEVRSWREECLYLDWDDDAIDHKLGVLAETIKQVDDGRGADIIAFQEVENVRILERLRNEHLVDLGYAPAILIEGTDRRGIDLAFLSRLPLSGKARLRDAPFQQFGDRAHDTRAVLEATFELPDGNLLTGFAVHFPAPHHPTEMRITAFEHLNGLRNEVPADHHVFAAGDFNTLNAEYYEQGLMERFVRPYWAVSSELCSGCRGSYYYRPTDTWSFLDVILYAPARGKKTTWEIRAESVHIANKIPAQMTDQGTPNRYRSADRTGVSDHWPVVVTIEPAQKQ